VAEHIRGLGRRALTLKCDVRDRRAVERAMGQAAEELGGPHILVANAGWWWWGLLLLGVGWARSGNAALQPAPQVPHHPAAPLLQVSWAGCRLLTRCPAVFGMK
jgi:NAD(P)-dependent dehydrogenase (short-subunit alcohol dehydrogenase family)